MGYSVFRVTYCVKHNLIYVIFNDTVQEEISIGLAETMIMAGDGLGRRMVGLSLKLACFFAGPDIKPSLSTKKRLSPTY